MHCTLVQGGDIQAIVGDASRRGMGGQQYCGVWSLASIRWPFNVFGNSYAGLIPGLIRGRAPGLKVLDERACRLVRKADAAYPVDVEADYRLVEPCAIDHELRFTDRRDMRDEGCSFREATWCSYINCPEDSRLNFLSPGGGWTRYISPSHGTGASIAPSYLSDEELEAWPDRESDKRPFHWHRADERFAQPFYYGRFGPMALLFVFDTPRWLRFYCSPSGGGASLLRGKTCPAWDFEWVIPEREYAVGREYRFRLRMIYKAFASDDDMIKEARRVRDELGFEAPPA